MTTEKPSATLLVAAIGRLRVRPPNSGLLLTGGIVLVRSRPQMQLSISVCRNRYSNGVEPLVVETQTGCVVYAFDGSGSWGTGGEAAAWFREWIATKSRISPQSVDAVTDLLSAAIRELPPEIVDCDGFGWAFSLAVIICRDGTVQVGSSGSVAALAVRSESIDRLFAPSRLVDELVKCGTISADEVENHKYRSVISSRFFGADDSPELQWCQPIPLCDGDRIVVGHAATPRFLETHAFRFTSATELRDAIENYGGSSTATVIVSRDSTPHYQHAPEADSRELRPADPGGWSLPRGDR